MTTGKFNKLVKSYACLQVSRGCTFLFMDINRCSILSSTGRRDTRSKVCTTWWTSRGQPRVVLCCVVSGEMQSGKHTHSQAPRTPLAAANRGYHKILNPISTNPSCYEKRGDNLSKGESETFGLYTGRHR